MARGAWQAALAAAALLAAFPARAQLPAAPAIVPQPSSLEVLAAPGLTLRSGIPIVAPAGDAGARAAAQDLSQVMRRTLGLELPVRAGAAPVGGDAILLVRAPAPSGEGYQLRVEDGRAVVTAHDDAGLFYGAVSLWDMAAGGGRHSALELPAVRIADAPRFAWRGLMIDSARHYQPPAEIEKIIDAMARLKLNVLHWHLTDDQAWRLEIRKYPRLTQIGGWRRPEPGSPDGARTYGGVYTQAEVRRIVAYAAARHVTIVPEIEMPGHALSALLAYPAAGAGPAPARADQVKWGGFPYVYGVRDLTFAFLEDVLTEVMQLFPGRDIHVGGDEAQRERWNASPAAQAQLAALGSTDPAVLQSWFTRRIAAFLAAHGRRLVGWDDILQGGDLPGDAVVTSWHGIAGGLAAAAKGHDAVLAPAPVYYFDNRQGLSPDEPPGRGWLVRLQDVYGFEPIAPNVPQAAAAHIVGVEAAVWTEHVRTSRDLEAMVFPRAAALAETAWSPREAKSWPGFFARLPAELARERALGLGPDEAALEVVASPGPADAVTLANPAGLGEVRYTVDGSDPAAASPIYSQPISSPAAAELKAALFVAGRRIGPVLARRIGPMGLTSRSSQELRLCNDKLALNLEGAPGSRRRTYLVNPLDPCWMYSGADLDRIHALAVSFERLPFNFAMDPAHDTTMVHPPRGPAGEIEVRQDDCLSDPLAIAALPPGGAGSRAELVVRLPRRSGIHDLCLTFTGDGFDPFPAVGTVTPLAGAAP